VGNKTREMALSRASAFETNAVQTLALCIEDLKGVFIKIKVTS